MLLPLLGAALAGETFTWNPPVDTTLAVAGPVFYGLLYTQVEETLPVGPLSPELGALDAWVEPRYAPKWEPLSDVLLYGTMAGGFAAAAADGARSEEAVGPRVGMMAQILALNGLVTDTLKLAADRPRPYTRIPDPDPEVQALLAEPDATRSFPSGHASMTAAMSFGAARIAQMSGTLRPQIGYPIAGGLTAAVSTLRVAAGVHHPTDVVCGALLGLSAGLLVPSVHEAAAASGEPPSTARVQISGRW